jgi:hypothetical protein
MWQLPSPRRPQPDDPRARAVLEWTDVVYYVFSRVFCAGVLVAAVLMYGPAALSAF